jgi:hypothetical protein
MLQQKSLKYFSTKLLVNFSKQMGKLTFLKQNSFVSLKKVNQFESFIYNFLILDKKAKKQKN